jgi:cytochrome P450
MTGTEAAGPVPSIPQARATPLDPPPRLAELRADSPITPLRFPGGHVGWLVTGHALARKVLSDHRFSSRNTLRRPVIRLPVADEQGLRPLLPGAFVAMDPPEHSRFRRPLARYFTARRVRELEPRIRRIVDEHLDLIERAGPPADLVALCGLTIPALVICEMLGVPYGDRDRFQRYATTLVRLDVARADAEAARRSLMEYLGDLVRSKHRGPAEDILGALVGTGDFTDEEVAGMAFLLLFAGYEITAAMFSLGLFCLLTNPAQLAALRAAPSLVPAAIEELLRYLSVVQYGTVRGALEDVVLGGVRVRAGESVCVSLPAANRDPAKFADPDVLDLTRHAGGHLAFGYGVHLCLGQQLARTELRIAYSALLQRFPALRLAVDAAEVPMRTETIVYGVHALPVTWGPA